MKLCNHRRSALTLSLCGLGLIAVKSGCSEKAEQACNPALNPSCQGGINLPPTGGNTDPASTKEGPLLPDDETGLPGGGGDGSKEDICEVEEVPARIQAANVMLVLDKSGSMQTKWQDHNNPQSRWASLYKIVSFMVSEFNESVRFGMKLFPAKDAQAKNSACKVDEGVEVPIADKNGMAIVNAMPGAGALVEGGTPAATGYARAVDYLKALAAQGEKRRRIVILVMDGRVADCDDTYLDLYNKTKEALADGISTFVVGIDVDTSTQEGLNLDSDLEGLALAGGTENYFDSSNAQKLSAAMEEIISRVSDCRIPLAKPPREPAWATVTLNNKDYRWLGPSVPSCQGANLPAGVGGFVYTQMEGKEAIELCGQACEDYVKTGSVKVNLLCRPPA